METNSKTSKSYRFALYLPDKLNVKRSPEHTTLPNFSIKYKWKTFSKSYKKIDTELSAPTGKTKIKLSDGSYLVGDIRDYFKQSLRNMKHLLMLPEFTIEYHSSGYILER